MHTCLELVSTVRLCVKKGGFKNGDGWGYFVAKRGPIERQWDRVAVEPMLWWIIYGLVGGERANHNHRLLQASDAVGEGPDGGLERADKPGLETGRSILTFVGKFIRGGEKGWWCVVGGEKELWAPCGGSYTNSVFGLFSNPATSKPQQKNEN